jgi:hypothetical protein
LENIIVLGLKSDPKSVTINGKTHEHKYDANTERLSLNKVNLNLVDNKNSIVWK